MAESDIIVSLHLVIPFISMGLSAGEDKSQSVCIKNDLFCSKNIKRNALS
jgi:hypothetical protein